jgi:phage-related tail protein
MLQKIKYIFSGLNLENQYDLNVENLKIVQENFNRISTEATASITRIDAQMEALKATKKDMTELRNKVKDVTKSIDTLGIV